MDAVKVLMVDDEARMRKLEMCIRDSYMRKCLYLDGENGSDQNTGESPEQALKTLKAVYKKLQSDQTAVGTLVFVVDEVTIGPAMSISLSNEIKQDNDGRKRYSGIYSEEEDGKETERIETGAQVFFKRYSQPEDLEGLTGYDKETYKGTLFTVNGTLTLSLIHIQMCIRDSGGGVYGYGSIADSRITGNEAQDGGGIYRSIKGRNLDISGNPASNYGGGVYGGGVFTNTRIQNNSASIGGGIFANDNYLTLTDDPAAETGMKKSCVTGNTACLLYTSRCV